MIGRILITGAALATLAACNPGSKGGAQDSGYATDADTGAAAPATQSQVSPMQPPDSTTGVSAPTGQPGVAGVRNAPSSDVSAPTGERPRP